MRKEINVMTGETTEHPDAPVTWEVPIEPVQVQPTKEELMAKLLEIQSQLEALS